MGIVSKLDPRQLGKRIKMARFLSSQSQSDLAEKIGVSQSTISNIECGREIPRVDRLLQIADILAISFSELIGDVDEPKKQNPNIEKLIEENPDLARHFLDYLMKKLEE